MGRARRSLLWLAPALFLSVAGVAFAVDAELRKMAEDPDSFKRSDAARALAAEGTPAAAKLLAKLLGDENPYVRDHTVNACSKVQADDAVEVLATAAKGRDELLRANVAAALGETGSTVALPTLRRLATSDKSARVRRAALDGLWEFKENADALAICADVYNDDNDASVRAAAIEAAGRVRAEGCVPLVHAGLADIDEGVRCVARMELPFVDEAGAVADLAASLGESGWRTRQQLVENAYRLMDAPSLDALVALVADERLRVADAAHRALVQITGKSLGRDRDIWQGWWDANREGWEAPGKRAGGAAPTAKSETSAVYHGLEITSANVVFVIDASGSMRDEVAGGKSGWDLAREELERAVATLPDGTQANVIVFQAEAKTAFDGLRSLSKKTRKTLATFLKRVEPGERGDLLAGVLTALDQGDVDTIYLLSDGAPSDGDHTLKNRVGDAIRSINRTRKVAIHTIGFGAKKSSERAFLKRLATDSMGRAKLD